MTTGLGKVLAGAEEGEAEKLALPGSSPTGRGKRGLVGAAVVLMCAVLVPLVTTLGDGTAGALSCPATGGTVSLNNGICAAAFSAYDANDNPVMTTQSFTVPAGITSLNVVVDGGFGGLADVGPGPRPTADRRAAPSR